MKTFVLTIFLALCTAYTFRIQNPDVELQNCYVADIKKIYQDSMYDFVVSLHKAVLARSSGNFVISLSSVWIMLAAIAEGCSKEAKQELFKVLKLPNNSCIRENLYRIATSRTDLMEVGEITNIRNLFLDPSLSINLSWLEFVSKNSLLNVVYAPINNRRLLASNDIWKGPGLNTTGNSLMLDSNIYRELWTTPFAGAVVERSPFYNQAGEEVGSIDLMRVTRKAKMGFVKSLNAKVLELPVDSNGFYVILLVTSLDNVNHTIAINNTADSTFEEVAASLRESNEPFDIAVPRMEITGQIDMRTVLEILGAKNIFTDSKVTKYISTPPAFPTSYVQHAYLIVNEKGFSAPTSQYFSIPRRSLGLDPRVGTNFIANKPFFMTLVDVETYTPLMNVAFMSATYPKHQ